MKDSRTMLEDWRRQSTHDDMHAASSANKRDFVEAGTTALERYRMKKLQKLEQAENSLPPSHGFSSGMPPRAVNSAPIFDDDDLTGDYSRVTMGTPAFSRRLAGGGRAARRRSFSVGSRHRARDTSPCLTQDSEGKFLVQLWAGDSLIGIVSLTRFLYDRSFPFSALEPVDDLLCSNTYDYSPASSRRSQHRGRSRTAIENSRDAATCGSVGERKDGSVNV